MSAALTIGLQCLDYNSMLAKMKNQSSKMLGVIKFSADPCSSPPLFLCELGVDLDFGPAIIVGREGGAPGSLDQGENLAAGFEGY